MRKYLELFKDGFDSTISEKIKPENWPYVGYSPSEGVKFTVIPKPQPYNEIWYTSKDGNVITPYKTDVFGANIVSNTYENGQGVMKYDNSVTVFGDWAFWTCSTLTSVTIPESVTSMGSYAFSGCSSLTSITIPNSVTSIGNGAFSGCKSLPSITIPNSVTSIGDGAFNDCSSLTSPVYNAHCFAYLPTSFEGAYTIPDGIKQIAGAAFDECHSLASIAIPYSVTSIGDNAFYGCTFVKDNFINNSTLDSVTNNYWGAEIVDVEMDGLLIKNNTVIDCRPYITSVTIPESITNIGNDAFHGCDNIKLVICLASTPPTLSDVYLSGNQIMVYVLPEYYDSYINSTWNGYGRTIVACNVVANDLNVKFSEPYNGYYHVSYSGGDVSIDWAADVSLYDENNNLLGNTTLNGKSTVAVPYTTDATDTWRSVQFTKYGITKTINIKQLGNPK